MERHRGHRSVIYEGDVDGAVEWREIKLYIFFDVSAALNQLGTTVFDTQETPAVIKK